MPASGPLTPASGSGMVAAVSEEPKGDPQKKHRHDYGSPDHGAVATETVTRGIQGLLIVLIALSLALVVYAAAAAAP